jgi:CDP-glycerol glycerophosphotransferase
MNSKLKDTIKKNKLLFRLAIYFKAKIIKGLYIIGGVFLKTDREKVVFSSFGGKSYSCNPRAVSEELHKMAPEFKIIWLFRDAKKKKEIVPEYIQCVEIGTLRAHLEQIKAGFWIDNFNKPITIRKKPDQIYIQLYHGDRGFKKILYDCRTLLANGHYKEGDLFETDNCDLMTSGSDYYNRVIKSAFNYKGEVLQVGSPRNDLFFKYDYSDVLSIKNKLDINSDHKVFLYAPTFRDSLHGVAHEIGDINLLATLKELEGKTKQRWICIIRAHSAVKGFANSPENSNQIIDVTKYEDMRDLLLITDLLITDYSSSAGDFALLKRPIILYQSDREKYLQDDRTFYFDIDTSPFTVVFNQEELNAAIQELDEIKILFAACL